MHCELRIPPLQGGDLLRNLTSYMAFQRGQIWATVLKASWWWRKLSEWETPLALPLALPCPAEREGRKYFVIVAGLSSPRRDMLFCKRGSCHFGRCPIHLVKVGSCFGFRHCCKWWVWHSPRLICSMSRQIYFARVLKPKVLLNDQIGYKEKIFYAMGTVKFWSRLSSTVLFLLRCAPWSAPASRIKYSWRCQPCAVPPLFDPFTAPAPEQNIRVWYLQNWAAVLYKEQRGIQLRCRVNTDLWVPATACKKCNGVVKRNDHMKGSLLFSLRNECIHPHIKGCPFNSLLFLRQ